MTKLDATAYLDNLGCAHVVYFHDDSKKTKETEFNFIILDVVVCLSRFSRIEVLISIFVG